MNVAPDCVICQRHDWTLERLRNVDVESTWFYSCINDVWRMKLRVLRFALLKPSGVAYKNMKGADYCYIRAGCI